MAPRLAVALDVPEAATARAWATRLQGHADVLKIGLELFISAGPDLVREIVDAGWGVFLDLKIHDIPATAERATAAACRLDVELLTLHASGGPAMLEAAVQAAGGQRTRLLAVTVLTSLDAEALRGIGWLAEPPQVVERLCRLAVAAGCDGVVSSVHEASRVKEIGGAEFLAVTPGIRPGAAGSDDQARVATPAAAVRAGADYLVVGRPILRASDPVAAADSIRRDMAAAAGAIA